MAGEGVVADEGRPPGPLAIDERSERRRRRVVGWSMADHMRTELVQDAGGVMLSEQLGSGSVEICELIEGVPTWVQDVCDTSTSG